MYNYNLDEAFTTALSIAENDEMNSKIDKLNMKLDNLTKTVENDKIEEKPSDELMPEWLDRVLDLEFLSPDDKDEYDKYDSLNNSLTGQLNGIYLEIERLNNDRNKALKDFDIPSVVDIDEKLKKLNCEYKDKFLKGEEIKKELVSKKNDWELSLNQLEEAFGSETWDKVLPLDKSKYSASVLKEFKKNKTMNMVKEFINDFPKEQREEVLRNPRIKDMLGESYNNIITEYM